MKYLITESRMNGLIKTFIQNNFEGVYDVEFGTDRIMLGSTEGMPSIERTVIFIILDNREYMANSKLLEYGKSIINKVDSYFGLNHGKYGSEWAFRLKKLSISDL